MGKIEPFIECSQCGHSYLLSEHEYCPKCKTMQLENASDIEWDRPYNEGELLDD